MLADATATSLTISGSAGLDLSGTNLAGDTALTSINASGITGTTSNVKITTPALAAAATIIGSATAANTIDFSAAKKAVTYTGGTGIDIINSATANTQANTINLGGGSANDLVSGANFSGANTVTSTSTGFSDITLGNGNNTITTAGTSKIVVGNGANTITTVSGDDYIVVGSGLNVINDGTGADVIKFTLVPAYGNVYTTITGASGDKLDVSGIIQGTVSTTVTAAIVLGSTAAFADYLNAAAKKGPILTVEEHTSVGGFGSAVLEHFASTRNSIPRIGIIGAARSNLMNIGDHDYLLNSNGLSVENIKVKFEQLL